MEYIFTDVIKEEDTGNIPYPENNVKNEIFLEESDISSVEEEEEEEEFVLYESPPDTSDTRTVIKEELIIGESPYQVYLKSEVFI